MAGLDQRGPVGREGRDVAAVFPSVTRSASIRPKVGDELEAVPGTETDETAAWVGTRSDDEVAVRRQRVEAGHGARR